MKRAWFVPDPFALMCGGLSFTLLHVYSMVMAATIPPLFELWREWPHVAWLGILIVVASPVIGVAVLHHFGHGLLDAFDSSGDKLGAGIVPRARSVWAGFFGWMVVLVSSMLATLILLALNPPEPPDPDAMHAFVRAATPALSWSGIFSFYSAVWVGIAAFLHHLERVVRARR